MKSPLWLVSIYSLYSTLSPFSTLLVEASSFLDSFFSTTLPPCGDTFNHANKLLFCEDDSVILPDGQRLYKDYDEKDWFGQVVHNYGKVYVPDGPKWKLRKELGNLFDPESKEMKIFYKPEKGKPYLLVTINQVGDIVYSSSLEYKHDGTIKIGKWFKGASVEFPKSGYQCRSLPCSIAITVKIPDKPSTYRGRKTMKALVYIGKSGYYSVLNVVSKNDNRGIPTNYLEIYSPVENSPHLQDITHTFREGTIESYKEIYYSVYKDPAEWYKAYTKWVDETW